jgi:hypothetical protein
MPEPKETHMPTLDAFANQYPDIPATVMLKVDLLRQGVRMGQAPLGTRHYHHHDEQGQKAVEPSAHLQGSALLPDGTAVFVSHNPNSPYTVRLDLESNQLALLEGEKEEFICHLKSGPRFAWTGGRTSRQTPMASVFTPSLGGGCGPLACFLLRFCEFVNAEEQCRFCSWVGMGKSHELRPNVGDFRQTLGAIWEEQQSIGYLAFSGGSLLNRTKEADAFLLYMNAVRETGLPLPVTVAAIQALDKPDSQRLRDAGFDYVCYSMEVWDEGAWQAVLPGKTRSVGRAGWMRRLTEAVEVFGEGKVMCNFVAGVEMAVPGLYASPEAAAESTLAGIRWCYENGVYPKHAVWITGGGAALGSSGPAPLAYYARLLPGRQQLFAEFPMAIPATDCPRCLTQSCEADLSRLDPARYGVGAASARAWAHRHAQSLCRGA